MKVGIVGFGQMGTGIAQVCAMAGYDTLVFDTNHKILEQNHSKLLDTLAGLVSKGKLRDYDLNQVRSNLHIATELKQFADRDIVIEAVIENPQVKAEVLKDLSLICSRNTIIASNTSSIAITFLASHVDFPNRVIGIHFMNPVPLMKLVEIIRGLQTDDQTYELSLRFVKQLNKEPVTTVDLPGFIVNRVLVPMILEAIRLIELGVDVMSVDTAMKLGANHPMGPLELADFVGLDTLLYLSDYIYSQTGDLKFKAPNLLRRMVEAGWVGRKSGKGFHLYEKI